MNTNEQTIHQMGLGISNLVKQATGRESVSSIDMDWVSVEQLARYIYGSGSGDVVSFDTNIPDAIESLIAFITAVQDLHGYDNPWPAGGGTNIFDEEMETGSIDDSTGQNASGSVLRSKNYIPVIPENQYYVTRWDDTGIYNIYLYDSSKQFIGNATGLGVITTEKILTIPANAYFIRFRTYIAYGTTYKNDIAINYPSSVTTYSPYSNICPITGWTGCNVTRRGVNMLDPEHYETFTFGGATRYGMLLGPGTYTIINNWESAKVIYYRKDSAAYGQPVQPGNKVTVTTAENMKVYSESPANLPGFCVRNDGGDTFEEYQGEVYAFTFPDEAGTVYGGTLDVLSGVLTVDRACVKASTLTWVKSGITNAFVATGGFDISPESHLSTETFIGNTSYGYEKKSYDNINTNASLDNVISWRSPAETQNKGILIKSSLLSSYWNTFDLSAFHTAVSDLDIMYEIAPITFQLTAQEVEALVGQTNNIFADTGNVSVQYKVKEDMV